MLALENARILDPERGYIEERGVLLIEGGYIKDFGSPGSVVVPDGYKVIDCKGMVLMPGLIDAHLHVLGMRSGKIEEELTTPIGVFFARAVNDLGALIDAGFTSVVDAGGIIALHLKQAVNEGEVRGPRVFSAGLPLSQTFGHGDTHYLPLEWVDYRKTKKIVPFSSLICDGEDDCRRAARYSLREGGDFIKVMASGGVLSQRDRPENRGFTLKELKAIVDEASASGTFVHAHAEGKVGIVNSAEAGVKVIAHAVYADEEAAEKVKEKGSLVVPTLSIVQRIIEDGEKLGIPDYGLKKASEVYERHIEAIKTIHRIGINIATGSDFDGGIGKMGNNALELKLLVEKVGLTPKDAIKAATINASKATGQELGRIERGLPADLILVEGNPLESVGLLLDNKNIKLVIKGGDIVKNIIGLPPT
ncbi:MAG: amidohydrolase family protein [Caldisphaeraceae archaeon]|nr:amidohydrolase family protein [Caldisphaeraceae archaeon]